MRRFVLPAVAVLAAVLALPAAAAPVSTGRIASVQFQLQPSAHVQLHLEVAAVSSAAGDRVELTVQRCEGGSCAYPAYYAGSLPAGALHIDSSAAAATLRARVAGLTLALDWSPVPPGTVVVQDTHGGGTDGDLAFTVARTDPAAARVVVDGSRCTGSGGVGDEARVEAPEGSRGDAEPLRGLTLPGGAPVCAS